LEYPGACKLDKKANAQNALESTIIGPVMFSDTLKVP